MENATRALYIAAGTLIGILVLSLLVYLVTSLGKNTAEINQQIEENQLAQFNGQFTKFNGRSDLTIHDVLTLANLAFDYNTRNEETTGFHISILLGTTKMEQKENLEKYIKNIDNIMGKEIQEDGSLKKYKCTVETNKVNRLVEVVKFQYK